MHMAVGGDEKPKFRCLDAGRYAVAFTVAVIVVVVIVHAVVTVLRPGELVVRLDGGHVSVSKVSPDILGFTFQIGVFNPSGRVRIYFTNILANISRSLTVAEFLAAPVDDFAVGQQDSADVAKTTTGSSVYMLPADFKQLYHGGSIDNAVMKLRGYRIVETYAGHNDTPKPVLYYCTSITVGGEEPENAPTDVPWCRDTLSASGTGST